MTTENGNSEGSTRPSPKFRFELDLAEELKVAYFQEVLGMNAERPILEYRKSNTPNFTTERMPGISMYGNITLKRGVFVNDGAFWDWQSQIKMNIIKRRTILIRLMDEEGNISVQWELNNAWPTKIVSTDLNSNGEVIAIDSLEIAHEL